MEFIIGLIHHNKSKRLAPNDVSKCQNCLEKITKTMELLYNQLACDDDTLVTSEHIWFNFENLDRPDEYDMYQCKANGSYFRTDSVIDFIRKCNPQDGYSLTKEEFVYCTLLGYWNLYVTVDGVQTNEFQKSSIEARWEKKGNETYDRQCNEKKRYFQ